MCAPAHFYTGRNELIMVGPAEKVGKRLRVGLRVEIFVVCFGDGGGQGTVGDMDVEVDDGTRTRNYLGKNKLSAFKAATAYVRSSQTWLTRSWRQHAFNITLSL